ncbi:unnamed protein product [Pleuronectes platessa]|uniref:Uncharacterized protein n=1 Tax=Pleuronectes platessa TaxID=8262 RepID=A0A9N7VGP2_PLEPL|nr:unnamed protein product [Pleuronectes platessa]
MWKATINPLLTRDSSSSDAHRQPGLCSDRDGATARSFPLILCSPSRGTSPPVPLSNWFTDLDSARRGGTLLGISGGRVDARPATGRLKFEEEEEEDEEEEQEEKRSISRTREEESMEKETQQEAVRRRSHTGTRGHIGGSVPQAHRALVVHPARFGTMFEDPWSGSMRRATWILSLSFLVHFTQAQGKSHTGSHRVHTGFTPGPNRLHSGPTAGCVHFSFAFCS